MILVDSNVPMYLVGADHPHKHEARRILDRLLTARERLVTDAEALQEILHRYVAIARRDAVQPAFAALTSIVDAVFPVEAADVVRAKDLALSYVELSARDALHASIMFRREIARVLSFDRGFDVVDGITRIPR